MNLTSTTYPNVLLLLQMACLKQLVFPTPALFPKVQVFVSGVPVFSISHEQSLRIFSAPFAGPVQSFSCLILVMLPLHSYSCALSRHLPNTSAVLMASTDLLSSNCPAQKPAKT